MRQRLAVALVVNRKPLVGWDSETLPHRLLKAWEGVTFRYTLAMAGPFAAGWMGWRFTTP